jgi:hypothetical protein
LKDRCRKISVTVFLVIYFDRKIAMETESKSSLGTAKSLDDQLIIVLRVEEGEE